MALVLFLQCLLGHYGDKWQEALNWFGATITPMLTLMLGGFVAKVAQKQAARKKAARKPSANDMVEGFPFFFAFVSCLVYLLACFLVLLVSPVVDTPPLATLKVFEQWLHLIQGVCGISLGWFFVSKHEPGGS